MAQRARQPAYANRVPVAVDDISGDPNIEREVLIQPCKFRMWLNKSKVCTYSYTKAGHSRLIHARLATIWKMSDLPPGLDEAEAASSKEAGKLFVGQLPHSFTEDDLKTIFTPYGTVLRVHIIRDRQSGRPKGCGFVTYAEATSASEACNLLHNKQTLPGMQHAMQVRLASEPRPPSTAKTEGSSVPEGAGTNVQSASADNHPAASHSKQAGETRIYVAGLPPAIDEAALRAEFEKYGEVLDSRVLKHLDTGRSRGVGFVRMKDEHAQLAITALHGAMTAFQEQQKALEVRVADADRRGADGGQADDGRRSARGQHGRFGAGGGGGPGGGAHGGQGGQGMGSAAAASEFDYRSNGRQGNRERGPGHHTNRVPPGGAYGSVPPLPAPGGPTAAHSRGMGMQARAQGAQAGGYGAQYGAAMPAVDPYAAYAMAMGMGYPGMARAAGMYGAGAGAAAMASQQALAAYTAASMGMGGYPGMAMGAGGSTEGPSGANLFVQHLPEGTSDQLLLSLFAPYGPILSAKVAVDRSAAQAGQHRLKDYGFVSFTDPTFAKAAMNAMNGATLAGGKRLRVGLKQGGASAPAPATVGGAQSYGHVQQGGGYGSHGSHTGQAQSNWYQ